jgi:opacity protein-like surface antigen
LNIRGEAPHWLIAAKDSARRKISTFPEVAMLRLSRWMSLIVAIAALSPMVAGADSTGMFAPDRVGHWYLGGGAGGYWEESNSQLRNHSGQFGGFFSGGYRAAPNIAIEIDGLSSYQRFDTPASVSSSNGRSQLTSSGAGGVVKLILPLDRIELYAGGGVGVYNTVLRVEDNPFKIKEQDKDVGYQGLVGADYFVTRNFSVGLEYRRFKLDAKLDPTIPEKIDAGGDFLFMTFRGHF